MNALTICKLNEDLVKKISKLLSGQHYFCVQNKQVTQRTPLFLEFKGSNPEQKNLIWQKLELIQDLMDMLQSASLMKIMKNIKFMSRQN